MRHALRTTLRRHRVALALLVVSGVATALIALGPDGARARLGEWTPVALGGAALVGIGLGVRQAWQRRWAPVASTTVAVGVTFAAAAATFAMAVLEALAVSASGDDFAVGLTIPEDLDVREPGDHVISIADPRGAALVALANGRADAPSPAVPLALPSREALAADELDALRDALAASPFWHVGEEHGRAFAYRRFATDGDRLHDSLNGFYGASVGAPTHARRNWRVVLGFGGSVFADHFPSGQRTDASSGSIALRPLPPRPGSSGPSTYLTLEGHPLVVEVYEMGPDEDRPMTRAALALVEDTLATFLRGEPLGPPRTGAPSLSLSNGLQPGIYRLTAQLNPGGPGQLYVRAFEVTREVELSATRLRDRTLQEAGWSPDPNVLFVYDTELTIYEGDWGQPYAARFEVWFVPASGGSERRLLSDVFRIEGWMR